MSARPATGALGPGHGSRSRPLIVHVLDRLSVGGMEMVALNVIEATRADYAHHVIGLRECGTLASRARALGVAVESVDKRAGKDIGAYRRLRRRLRTLAPAIVHTYNIGALDVCVWARLAGVARVVHAEHGRDVSDPHGTNPKYRWLRRLMTPFISVFVPVSLDLARWLEHDVGVPAAKIRPIHNGIETDRFTASVGSSEGAAALSDEDIVIGSVGRLDAVKAFDTLIEAFAVLCRRRPKAPLRLVIAGDGPERAALATRIEQLGLEARVSLVGACNEVPALLDTLSVYVCSSRAEGIALTILEAMAAARPVVATRVGGNPELVEPGRSGLLVPPEEPAALADALQHYLDNPAQARAAGQAGRKRALAEFDVATMVRRYGALYEEFLAPGRAPDHG